MTEFLVAWTVCMTVACFVVLAVVIGLEVRDNRAAADPHARPVPPIPEQRQSTSAAAIVVVHDAESFERFLAELISPYSEGALR